jgi:tellurite resistance protein TehA-like permease
VGSLWSSAVEFTSPCKTIENTRLSDIGLTFPRWSTQTFTISQMTPIWIFPAYPLLITGPFASVLAPKLPAIEALQVIIGGVIFQGIGFMVSLMIYAAFIYRLMTQKLPQESLRPGMFISVGPSGFTISGIVGMGQHLPKVVPKDFMGDGELAGKVSMVLANWVGLWLWGLAIWFCFVSVFAHWSTVKHNRWRFAMTWYSYVFPNTALCTATFAIAQALDSRAIRITGCVMTCVLICIWLTVFVCMIRAVFLKDILWPQKQEDRDEGGWKGKISDERGDERTLNEGEDESQADGDEGGGALSRVVSALSQRSRRKRKNTTGSNV